MVRGGPGRASVLTAIISDVSLRSVDLHEG